MNYKETLKVLMWKMLAHELVKALEDEGAPPAKSTTNVAHESFIQQINETLQSLQRLLDTLKQQVPEDGTVREGTHAEVIDAVHQRFGELNTQVSHLLAYLQNINKYTGAVKEHLDEILNFINTISKILSLKLSAENIAKISSAVTNIGKALNAVRNLLQEESKKGGVE